MLIHQDNSHFERIEKKFRMTPEQYRQLLPVLESHMERDSYGETRVHNIFYDTPDLYLIRRSVERPLFKEKLRLRSYGIPTEESKVYVEIKRKLNGIGYKRRICVNFSDAKRLLKGESIDTGQPQIGKEILEFVRRYHPTPAVCLSYLRYAMYGREDPHFRITIDRDLRYRTERPEAPDEDDMIPVMPDNDSWILMEIKAMNAIPLWLTEEMSRLKIHQAPFSKIGTCYTLHLAGTQSRCEERKEE